MGADVVVDVSNAPVWDDDAVMKFFTTSSRNLLAAAVTAWLLLWRLVGQKRNAPVTRSRPRI